MWRHVLLMLVLVAGALAAGLAMVPGSREQWTMLVRDGRNEAALRLLDARYQAGERAPDAMLQFYRLLMAAADVPRATHVIERLAAARPGDVETLTLLARHYADTQDRDGEIGALERLYALAPSPRTARELLSLYRLAGDFGHEQDMLRRLLANKMIAANDAERYGLMRAAQGDLQGARAALGRFDEIANPERFLGRLALFEVLVRLGETETALAKAVAWMPYWRKARIHRPAEAEGPAVRLARMMIAADASAARRILCAAERADAAAPARGALCPLMPADAGEREIDMAATRNTLRRT
jgi:hypothetical protein